MSCSWIYAKYLNWWRQRTDLEKVLVIASLLLILIVIIMAITMEPRSKSDTPTDACINTSCLVETSKLLRFMDERVDPCDDFFMFTCGGFDGNAYDEERLSFKNIEMRNLLDIYKKPIQINEHKMVKASKKFFHVCSNTTGLESGEFTTMKRVLKSVGGWPLLEGDKWDETNFDWLNVIYKLRNMGLYYSFFLDLQVAPDPTDKNEQTYMLKVSLAEMHNYSYDTLQVNKIQHMTSVAVLLGAPYDTSLTAELTKIHEFFKKFEAEEQDFGEERFSRYTIKDIQEECPSINWLEYINKVLGPSVQMDRGDAILFPSINAMNARLDIVLKTPKRVLANYMMMKLVEKSMPFLHQEMRDIHVPHRKLQTHEEFCLETIENMYLLSPIEIMWMEKHTTRAKSKKLEDFLYALKEEVVQKIDSIPWSTKEEKQTLLEKARNLLINIGIPSNYTAEKILGELQVDMIEPESESLLDLYAQQNRNKKTAEFQQMKKAETDKFFWKWERANMVRPFYLEHENEILLPSVVSNAFHFNENLPNYLNYGVIGAIIGNQFSEMLLNVKAGIEFVKKLNAGRYTKVVHAHLNDQETRALYQQVVAEQLSYSVYQKWVTKHDKEQMLPNLDYTQNQLFWISAASSFCSLVYADPPLTTEIRWKPKLASVLITGSMRYNSDFVNDFHCSS